MIILIVTVLIVVPWKCVKIRKAGRIFNGFFRFGFAFYHNSAKINEIIRLDKRRRV